MKDTRKQRDFIQLKAEGKSNAQIARALHISESTASRYSHTLAEEITRYKAEQLKELYDTYYMTREARIKQLGSTLSKIEEAASRNDYKLIPMEKLLDLKLKYTSALKAEHLPLALDPSPLNEVHLNTASKIISQMDYLRNKLREGEMSPEFVNTELKVLESMLKAYELVEMEDRLKALEDAVSGKETEQ